ncbi:MAG TPA: TolC family protein, partial [Planctomycetaceae bacterium]|nr:TolC family protein [Planctomycetaceae bacterium]
VWAAAEKIPQVTSLDDPVLADTFQPIASHSLQTAAGRTPNLLTLSQRFPWFGKLRLRGEIAEEEVQIALTRLVRAQLKVVEDVKVAYAEVFFAQRAIEVTEHNIELLEDLLSFAEARYRTGQSSQQDVLRAQVELDRLQDRLIGLRRQLRQAQADLASVLHTSPEADLRAVEQLPVLTVPDQIQALYEAAVACRPELQEQLHAIVLSQRAQELAELQYYPDLTLGFGWQALTTDEALARSANGNDNIAFLVGVNLPIWYDRLNAAVRQAEYQTMEYARRYDATKDDTFRLIKRLVVQARALDEQARLFRESIVPKAEQTLRVSTADYRVGRVDFEQILDNWTDLLNFQIQLVRLEASLAQTLATLERVIGCELAAVPDVVGERASPA